MPTFAPRLPDRPRAPARAAVPCTGPVRSPLWPLTALAVMLTVLAMLAPAPALAEVHRLSDTQTGWYWLYNVTVEDVNAFLAETDARIIDVEIHAASPLRLTVAFVQNEGVYASGWWWYYGLDFEEVARYVVENQGRLIDIERYVVGDQTRWAVVMVPNVGDQQKAWWYYAGLRAEAISSYLETNQARLVDIESYDTAEGRRYAVIMIANAGDDATPWGWFYNVDLATLTDYMDQNGMRLLEFEVRDPSAPTFDAVMVPLSFHTPHTWWWYYNVTADRLADLTRQAASRITDLDTYLVDGERRFSAVLLNNANDLTVAAGEALQWGSDGWTGAYLKEVDGPTLAYLQPDFVFEPASTIKAIHHLHAMRSVMAGQSSLGQPVTYSENYSGSCPVGGAPFTTQSLQETLRRMMVNSDNAATEGITQLYGQGDIEQTAQLIAQMASTELNHTLGCAAGALSDPNRLTLRDAGRLYEGVQTLDLLDQPRRDTFYALMQNQDTPAPWWFTNILRGTIDQVAGDLGLPDQIADDYWEATLTAWKPGGYTLNGLAYTSVAGVVSLPRCTSGPMTDRTHYVFGIFVEGAADGTSLARIQAACPVLFRDLIAAEMQNCPTAVDGLPLAQTLLAPPHPNPFNPRTELAFSLERPGEVHLAVYDAAGRRLAVLAEGHHDGGRHTVVWNGRDQQGRPAAAGVYIARLVAGDRVESRKLALIK